jgi:hypothetical protein
MNNVAIRFLAVGLVVGVFLGVLSSQTDGAKPNEAPPVHPEIPRISAWEAKRLFTQGKLILANAQEREGFEKSWLIGAISMPNGEVQTTNPRLPTNVIVAFYCM